MSDREDAERWRWLCWVMEQSVAGYVEVNRQQVFYEAPEPGKEVSVTWYPDTPVGSYEIHGRTLTEVVDAGMVGTWHRHGQPMVWPPTGEPEEGP